MTAEAVVVLALLQGLTEFLPISSSAHLILAPNLLGWSDQGLAFDVAVHVGTLLAVLLYFRRQIAALLADWIASLRTRTQVGESALAWGVLIGTLPVALAGLALEEVVETHLRSPLVIAAATICFGLVLWLSDWTGRKERGEETLTVRDCVWIGLAQALALIPGTSRAGITITAGMMVGLTPASAARFSFLLSIPTIFLAGGAKSYDLLGGHAVDWPAMALGAVISAASAYACIHAFLKLLDRVGMLPFILYRLGLGVALLFIYW
jgi:undecaprenyl-diphosphatase